MAHTKDRINTQSIHFVMGDMLIPYSQFNFVVGGENLEEAFNDQVMLFLRDIERQNITETTTFNNFVYKAKNVSVYNHKGRYINVIAIFQNMEKLDG